MMGDTIWVFHSTDSTKNPETIKLWYFHSLLGVADGFKFMYEDKAASPAPLPSPL